MARKSKSRARRWRLHFAALLVLTALVGAVWYWWDMRQWAPDEALYPDQGVAVGQRHGPVDFATVRALGGKFASLGASPDRKVVGAGKSVSVRGDTGGGRVMT